MNNFPYLAGPPDPIDFLRRVSEHDVRFPAADEVDLDKSQGHADTNGARPLSPNRYRDAPARERPPPGQAWPYRVRILQLLPSSTD